MRVEPKTLARRLTPTATRMLEAAIGKAANSQHYEITVEHLLEQMLLPDDGDAAAIFHHLNQNRNPLLNRVQKILQHMRTGNSGRPTFSLNLWNLVEETWLYASLEQGDAKIRSGMLLYTLIKSPGRHSGEEFPELDEIDDKALRGELQDALSITKEAIEAAPIEGSGGPGKAGAAGPAGAAGDSALARFCTNITEDVRQGRIDPIFGRHREIRQCIDILSRRRKNNPIIVGEPGVGKTALAEGLAHEIVKGNVPKHLANCDIMSLDMGTLQAGASVKGEFENRLKAVISEVKGAAKPIILFIDEAHTLIGSGGQKGGSDASNLLKPALARGELRTVAATTWAEYKKYFEKDAALERRFQTVKVDEPSVENATVMLRGLREMYEKAHGVRILDEAVVAAVELSSRYISGRLLPDKAVDLLDTSAARVRVERGTKPEELAALEAEIAALERAVRAIKRDVEDGHSQRTEELQEDLARLEVVKGERDVLFARWKAELAAVEAALKERGELEEEEEAAEGEQADGEASAEADSEDGASEPAMVEEAAEESSEETEEAVPAAALPANDDQERLVHLDVDAESVARTVSSWTGIPLGKMQRNSVATVLHLEDELRNRVIGQEPGINAVAEGCRMSFAGVRNPEAPVGVFLFVGPSGVGKTETALALADLLFGGERFITQINMSEYQEKHTVSRLIGSPPGYVGYGEGGVLTEAVRQRPYSVVLLDECEKAERDVLNLFYQVFDKGTMNDGEGRLINFRNTICILTSNLATDLLMEAYEGGKEPTTDEVIAQIRPTLSKWFAPALLARMTVVPYRPLNPEALQLISRLKLKKLAKLVRASHNIETTFSDELVADLASRCTEAETGARNVDHILRATLQPMIARALLERMAADEEPTGIEITVAPSGEWRVDVDIA